MTLQVEDRVGWRPVSYTHLDVYKRQALASDPEVLLLDEPTTGLDASVAAGVLDLLRELIAEREIAVVVVSHDFGVIRALTDRALVMRAGRVIETGLTDQLFADPHDAYTQRLVAAAHT